VRQPLEEVAVQVVRLLDDRLAMRSSDEPHVILTPQLRQRTTT
jgi:DNA-binding LacI/PurR family transcriptional regulator